MPHSSLLLILVVTSGLVAPWTSQQQGRPGRRPASAVPTPPDCNSNGVADSIDLATGISEDCDGNSIPDECDVQARIHVRESFEGGLPWNWTFNGIGQITGDCAPSSPCHGTSFYYFGDDTACNFDSPEFSGEMILPTFRLPANSIKATLSFCFVYEGEGAEPYDAADVFVNGLLLDHLSTEDQLDWTTRVVNLMAFVGQDVSIRFAFDAMDDSLNEFLGWQVDDVRVMSLGPRSAALDCNLNGIPDSCDPDCNSNAVPDDCDIASGFSADCQLNGIPDACEIALSLSPDCNGNQVPDECDLTTSLQVGAANLAANASALSALVPDRYDFLDGEVGTCISSGGMNMYSCGNELRSSNLIPIPYTGSALTPQAPFGPGSQYFTTKLDGLFVMAAAHCEFDWFGISGNTGTSDPGAQVDTLESTFSVAGLPYTMFVRRLYDAVEPSINQIIIVPGDGTGLSHNISTGTSTCHQVLSGLSAADRIYYVLASRHVGGIGPALSLADALAISQAVVGQFPAPVSMDADDDGVPDECP